MQFSFLADNSFFSLHQLIKLQRYCHVKIHPRFQHQKLIIFFRQSLTKFFCFISWKGVEPQGLWKLICNQRGKNEFLREQYWAFTDKCPRGKAKNFKSKKKSQGSRCRRSKEKKVFVFLVLDTPCKLVSRYFYTNFHSTSSFRRGDCWKLSEDDDVSCEKEFVFCLFTKTRLQSGSVMIPQRLTIQQNIVFKLF